MDLVSFALNAAGVIAGAGISWGYLRNEVKNLRSELSEEKITNKELDEKITFLKDRGMNLVFRTDCGILRDECRDNMVSKIAEIKKEVWENRELAAKSSREVLEFMGYSKAILEELRRRYL